MVGVVVGCRGARAVALVAGLALGALAGVVPTAAAHAAPAKAVTPAASTAGGVYVPVTPTRVEDTRSGPGVVGRLAGGGSVTVAVPTSLVPTGSSAVAVNVTAADPTSVGNLATYPGGTTEPQTSTVNFDPGRDVANAAIVSLSSANTLTVTDNSSGGVDVVVDVDGYFTASPTAASGGAGHYYPLTPGRVTDTRSTSGQANAGKTLAAGSTLNVQVGGQGGIPSSGVEAVVANLTATDVSAGADFLTAFAAGAAQPGVSNLNVGAGDTRANRVIVPVSSSGAISIYNNAGTADVIVDVDGYVSDQTGSTGGGNLFTATAPTRVLDTRNPGGTPFSATPTVTTLAGQAGLQSAGGVTAVAMNVTEANSSGVATGSTYLTTYPAGTTAPLASDLNYPTGDTRPNLDIATLNPQGQVAGIVGSGTANVIYDVTGYFTPASPSQYSVTLSPSSGPPGTVVTGTITQTPGSTTSARPAVSGVSQVTVNGCGLSNQTEPVSSSGTFTFTIPSSAPSGNCAISVTINGETTTAPGGYTVSPANGSLTVTTTSLPSGTVGSAYPSTTLTASGGSSPYTWTATGLPAGLALSTGGVLSGTPTTAGTSSVNVTVTDSKDATANATFSLIVNPASAAPHETDYPPSFIAGYAVSCPSTTTCTAVGSDGSGGGEIIGTTDGGTTWTVQQTVPANVGAFTLTGVSCPSVTTCTAVGLENSGVSSGGRALTTTDGGQTWVQQIPDVPGGSLSGVSCPTVKICFAVGQAAYMASSPLGGVVDVTTDGGATWNQQTTPNNLIGLGGIACPSVTTCTAVGSTSAGAAVISTDDGGSTWVTETIPSGSATALAGISCPSTAMCTAVGQDNTGPDGTDVVGAVLATTNGGSTWASQTIPSDVEQLFGVSCSSTTTCIAVGLGSFATAIATTNGGSSWTAQTIPAAVQQLIGVSCATASACTAVGSSTSNAGDVIGTTSGGATWTQQAVPTGIDFLSGASCPTSAYCAAVGESSDTSVVITSSNGGSSWTQQPVPAGIGELSGLSCPTVSTCTAVGSVEADGYGGGVAIVTTNGGTSWTEQAVPSDIQDLAGIDCPSSSDCFAFGATSSGPAVIGTVNGGTTWTQQTIPGGVYSLYGLSCGSVSSCAAAGSSYNESSSNGVVIATADGGTTWVEQSIPAGITQLAGIACQAASDCIAVGSDTSSGAVIATTDGGRTWVQQDIPTNTAYLSGVACSSVSSCVAVGDYDGPIIITTKDGGGSWTQDAAPLNIAELNAIACPSSTGCVTVGTNVHPGGAMAYAFTP